MNSSHTGKLRCSYTRTDSAPCPIPGLPAPVVGPVVPKSSAMALRRRRPRPPSIRILPGDDGDDDDPPAAPPAAARPAPAAPPPSLPPRGAPPALALRLRTPAPPAELLLAPPPEEEGPQMGAWVSGLPVLRRRAADTEAQCTAAVMGQRRRSAAVKDGIVPMRTEVCDKTATNVETKVCADCPRPHAGFAATHDMKRTPAPPPLTRIVGACALQRKQ